VAPKPAPPVAPKPAPPAKPAAPKASAPKAKRTLVRAEGEHAFWVNYGPVLHDLRQLRDALGTMSDEQFSFHVSEEKNDFDGWVEGVLKDAECARGLRKALTRLEALAVVEKSLEAYA
jgi:hypothetical protein